MLRGIKETKEIEELINTTKKHIQYEKAVEAADKYLAEKKVELAHEKLLEAQQLFNSPELEKKISALKARMEQHKQLVNKGIKAMEVGDYDQALDEYRKAAEVIPNDETKEKILELEQKVKKYQFHIDEGRRAFDRQDQEVALDHFKKAEALNKTEETVLWIDRTERMPCTIIVFGTGNEEKMQNVSVELIDYYTLDLEFSAPLSRSEHTFPKVKGGKDTKYYVRAFIKEGDGHKRALTEKECDCSSAKRRYKLEINVE